VATEQGRRRQTERNKGQTSTLAHADGAKVVADKRGGEESSDGEQVCARAECLKIHGSACCVCGFNFGTTYGSVGSGFNFVHHRVPVAARARDAQYELDPGRDLVPICGNCHAIVHWAQITEDYSLGQIRL